MQKVVADNVRALMGVKRNGLDSQAKIAEAARRAGFPIDQKTVSRALREANSVQLDTVAALAAAFEVEPYQLLVPGLDPRNPQILRKLSADEERFYKVLEDIRRGGTQ